MAFMSLTEIIIGTFVLLPIIVLIHELGHGFFAWLFGAKIEKIVIGTGKTIITLGKLEIKSIYFLMGHFKADKLGNGKISRITTLLGGVLFNVASCIIVKLLDLFVLNSYYLSDIFITFSICMIIFALVPITYFDNTNSDGLQVYQTIKNGTSNYSNSKDIKNL